MISKSSFGVIILTKNQRFFYRISPLASKKWSNQKNKRKSVKVKFSNHWYKVPLFFDLTSLGQKSLDKLRLFYGRNLTKKGDYEINWPLTIQLIKQHLNSCQFPLISYLAYSSYSSKSTKSYSTGSNCGYSSSSSCGYSSSSSNSSQSKSSSAMYCPPSSSNSSRNNSCNSMMSRSPKIWGGMNMMK